MSQKYLIPVQNVQCLYINLEMLSSNRGNSLLSRDSECAKDKYTHSVLESFDNHSEMLDLSRESVQYVCTRFRSPHIARRYGHKIYADYQENRDNNACLTSDWP